MRKLFQQNHARLGCSLSPRSPSFSGKGPAAAINHSRPETRTVAYDRRRPCSGGREVYLLYLHSTVCTSHYISLNHTQLTSQMLHKLSSILSRVIEIKSIIVDNEKVLYF